MQRREFLKMLAAAGATSALPRRMFAADDARRSAKPNIVLIMADDLGYECIGANGGTSYKTPHLDRMASAGMRFDHCYAQPLCTPTRVQIMSGIYNVRNYTHFGHMDPGVTTFGNLLRDAGYATCITGKWQLGGDADQPRKFGFDEHYLWQLSRRPPRYANPGLEIMGKPVDYTNGEYGPELLNRHALDFITRKKDQPFFLYYPMVLPHSPHQPTPDSADWDPAAIGERVNDKPKHFADMVAYIDKMVGRVLGKLDELKLRDNTLVIFLGDNGTNKAIDSKLNGRTITGNKGKSTDAGTHVPMFARMPGVVKAGAVSNDLVDTTDFLPTLCELAGVTVPAELAIDGQSFLSQLRGNKGQRQWVYCWYSRDGRQVRAEFARDKRYKLYADGRLYDTTRDALEQSPLPSTDLDANAQAARDALQGVLDKYQDARPRALRQNG